ncbi:MAG TPA: fibronectin type III domain-containing protein [Bacteriovoracaceae bacterium]|nr:fibronectin type III domain-containing protein [Bacteriovoracaceae bacterium]
MRAACLPTRPENLSKIFLQLREFLVALYQHQRWSLLNGFNTPASDASSVTPTGAVLNWTAQPSASYYKIYRVTPGPTTALATISNVATNTYPLTGLTTGVSYEYRINAFDASDVSDGNANLAAFTTPAGTGASFNGWSDVVATGR